MIARVALAIALLAATACAGEDYSDNTPRCLPGTPGPTCGCRDGRSGTLVCAADGTRYAECNCDDAGVADDTPADAGMSAAP